MRACELATGLVAAGENWVDAVGAAERALADPGCRASAPCVSKALGALVCAGELVVADAHSIALLDESPGDRAMAEHVLLVRAQVARRTGDLARCAALLEALRDNGSEDEIRPEVLFWSVELLAALGEPRAAGAVLRGYGGSGALLLAAEAVVAMASGRPEDALTGHLAFGQATGVANPAVLPWRSWASRAALACGDTGQARRLAAEEHAAACRWGEPRALGSSLAAVAACSSGGEALVAYERAIRLLELAHARAELAHVLCDYADHLTAQGKQAAEIYGRARATALDIGHDALVRRCGIVRGDGPALTPVETEVARLVRAGLANREVAARLAMATRTVELHLTRVYRKLGLSGRRELRTLRTHRGASDGFPA
ncbi:LuxR C-terminal-related transcriptional regulator [Lentzea sp. NPDC058450]|uniref:helix-turn-helix transcriptional regulator n=1 Tax=Lentzea sp. NPDC058450 TaxID=3346505 RepID=UPI003661C759